MDRWGSDHDITFYTDRQELIEYYAKKEYDSQQKEHGSTYFTILINGRDRNNDIWNDDIMGLENEAEFDLIEDEVKKLVPIINVYQKLKG